MKKLVALFAVLAFSAAYANQGDSQNAENPAPAAEEAQTQEQSVIKQKKATDEGDARTEQEENSQQAQENK